MKKRLLFAAFALMSAVGSFAYNVGDYVYTSTQRLKITGENQITTGTNSLDGWTDAAGEAVDPETWTVEPGVGAAGEDAIKSGGANEGMALCRSFVLDAGTYVVSYQIKGSGTGTTTIGTSIGSNYADIFLNTDGAMTKVASTEEAPVVNVAAAANFTDTWTTVNYFFTVEAGQILVMHFEKFATDLMMTNFSIQTAEEVTDIRPFQRKIAYAKRLMEDPNFNTDAAAGAKAELQNEAIDAIEALMASGDIDVMPAEDLMTAFDEKLNAYLDVTTENIAKNTYFNYSEDLTAFPKKNRGDIKNGEIVGGFKFVGDNWWHSQNADFFQKFILPGASNHNGEGTISLYNKIMPAGKYFISAEMRNGWTRKDWGLDFTFEAPIKAFVGSNIVDCGTIKGEEFSRIYIVADFDGATEFEAGFKWEAEDVTNPSGGFQIKSFEIRSFSSVSDYVAHIEAWNKFIAQYNAMVGARNKLIEMMGNKNYPWSQGTLTEAKTTWDPYYNDFMAKGWVTANGEDAGVASTEELETWATTTGIEGMEAPYDKYALVRGYQYATNAVIEANKPFTDLATAIDEAKATRNKGANATGDRDLYKDAIVAAIATIKQIRETTTDETREADTERLNAALAALNAATADFMASITNAPIVDIDFSNSAVENPDGGYYYVDGVSGRMTFDSFNPDNTADDQMFTIGRGEDVAGVLRIGKGSAIVDFDAPSDGDNVRATFDMWIGGLIKRYVFVDLRNANDERVAGFRWKIYDGEVAYNDFNDEANQGMNLAGKNQGTSKDGDAVLYVDKYKYAFDLELDYATNTVKGKLVQGSKGTVEGKPVPMQALEDNKVVKFVVGSDYDSAPARRAWFDNLKIYKSTSVADFEEDITESPWAEVIDGIETVATQKTASNAIYTLSGVRVAKAQKGLYIQNGKKFVVK